MEQHEARVRELSEERDALSSDLDAATAELSSLERGVDAHVAEMESLEAKNSELLREVSVQDKHHISNAC